MKEGSVQFNMAGVQLIKFDEFTDQRGSLMALEANKNIPFMIKRVYCIYNNKSGLARGAHAHKALHQVMFALSGSCTIKLFNGTEEKVVVLEHPNMGLLINGVVWREMHDFSKDCVLTVLASDHFDESDYIHDYKDFKAHLTIMGTQ